jgi:hypothetical protein
MQGTYASWRKKLGVSVHVSRSPSSSIERWALTEDQVVRCRRFWRHVETHGMER